MFLVPQEAIYVMNMPRRSFTMSWRLDDSLFSARKAKDNISGFLCLLMLPMRDSI
jgi:hypothetical protein